IYAGAPWLAEMVRFNTDAARQLRSRSAPDLKEAVARASREYVRNGGFLFAMCTATETIDLALAAEHADIAASFADGTPIDPDADARLDWSRTLAFTGAHIEPNPQIPSFSDIDGHQVNAGPRRQPLGAFTLFNFSAKIDPVPTMLIQNHRQVIPDHALARVPPDPQQRALPRGQEARAEDVSVERLAPAVQLLLRAEIGAAQGREVSFVGRLDGNRRIVEARVVARGTVDAVLALPGIAERGEILLHNHPSGVLEPSGADLAVAARLHDGGVGFAIVDNDVTACYVVVEVPRARATARLDPVDVAALLAEHGPVARVLRAFEDRPSQRAMAAY